VKKQLIGLDFDGVFSNCGKLKSETAKKLYRVDIPPERFKKEMVLADGLITEKQYRTLQRIIYEMVEIGLTMEPVEGVQEFVPKLLEEGHKVIIVTSRNGIAAEIAKKWMVKHGLPNLPLIEAGYQNDKSKHLEGFDIFIDDDLDKLEPAVGIVPHLFLFSWGYNKHIDETEFITRINSWKEFYQAIAEIARTSK